MEFTLGKIEFEPARHKKIIVPKIRYLMVKYKIFLCSNKTIPLKDTKTAQIFLAIKCNGSTEQIYFWAKKCLLRNACNMKRHRNFVPFTPFQELFL